MLQNPDLSNTALRIKDKWQQVLLANACKLATSYYAAAGRTTSRLVCRLLQCRKGHKCATCSATTLKLACSSHECPRLSAPHKSTPRAPPFHPCGSSTTAQVTPPARSRPLEQGLLQVAAQTF
jgi:hypothetical protein